MENKKFKISKENYELLSKMIALAEKRNPVQGEFSFENWNGTTLETKKKEGVLNCGTSGCLAGGYLPLIDNKRFFFGAFGHFLENDEFFFSGELRKELGDELFFSLFYADEQYILDFPNLTEQSTLKEVIENAKKVLELCEI